MTVKELLRDWLDDEHYVGLCNPELECGCGLDDLMPCGSNCGECQPVTVFENGDNNLSQSASSVGIYFINQGKHEK